MKTFCFSGKTRFAIGLALSLVFPGALTAQVQIQSRKTMVFGGGTRRIELQVQNPQSGEFDAPIRFQVYQAGSATVVPVGKPRDWKKLRVLPGQTVLETAAVEFPALTAKSRFLIEWLNEENKVLGRSDLTVYPTNVLEALKPLLRGTELGVWDPGNALKPQLERNGVELRELGDSNLGGFNGRLAVLFSASEKAPEPIGRAVEQLVSRGTAVVWIRPKPSAKERAKPSFYLVRSGKGAAVVVQPETIANFSDNPGAQENLVQFSTWAMRPEPLHLPDTTRENQE